MLDKFGNSNIAAKPERWADAMQRTSQAFISSRTISVTSDNHFNAQAKRIKNLHEPIEDQDAVTKSYVHQKIVKLEEKFQNLENKVQELREQLNKVEVVEPVLLNRAYKPIN